MRLSRLKWAFLATLAVLFVFVEFARYNLLPFLQNWQGRLMMDLVILFGSLFFFGFIFDQVSRMHGRLERQNRELLALHGAALDIYGELSLDTLLQRVVHQASQLLEARYGAVTVIDDEGQVREFITAGISPAERQRIGEPPTGRGLLGVALREGRRLRIDRISDDPRSAGLPPHHPPMESLLAVPIVCKGPFRGNLYLTEKKGSLEFTREDEETLERFATAVAIAIDNARLHERLNSLAVAEERLRIAREMHDGMAQILAYVNTKAQAVKGHLDRGRSEEAGRQLEQLAEAAREVYTEAREGIEALRTELGPDHNFNQAIEEYLAAWQQRSGIEGRLRMEDDLQLPAMAELQLLRILQEALSNVRKHSGASVVQLDLRQVDGRLEGRVEDDGRGFDPAALERSEFPRFGLAIMRERAESVNGELEVDSRLGGGTRVRIAIPLRN